MGFVLLSLFSGPHNFYNLLPQKFCITSYNKTHLFFFSSVWGLAGGWLIWAGLCWGPRSTHPQLPWISGLAEICSLVMTARHQRSTGNIHGILSLGLKLACSHFWLILLAKASCSAAYPVQVKKFTDTEEVKNWGSEINQIYCNYGEVTFQFSIWNSFNNAACLTEVVVFIFLYLTVKCGRNCEIYL